MAHFQLIDLIGNQIKMKNIKEKAAYSKVWLLDTFHNTKELLKRNLFFVIQRVQY